MSFWNGTEWLAHDDPFASTSAPHRSRARDWLATGIMIAGLAAMALPLGAVFAGRSSGSECSISPDSVDVGEAYVISVSGLPTRTAINLWVTDPSGDTTGEPIGGTTDGTFRIRRSSDADGVWTYAFSGPTKRHTTMYARCSVDVY